MAKSLSADAVSLRVWCEESGEQIMPMTAHSKMDGNLLYRAAFSAPAKPGLMWYYFIIKSAGKIYYYGNNRHEMGGPGEIYDSPPPAYQITVHLPEAATPDWFKNAVVYQIFVDRFFNGNPDGKIDNPNPGSLIHACWQDDPVYVRERETGRILSYDFFGGNLRGVIAKLPYLKTLGISAIYLNPVFESPSNHKYDTADYKNIDPMFGDNKIFQELCDKARKLGIAVILDGVFSHTGSDSIYFNKDGNYPEPGAYQSPDSPYYPWYRFSQYPDEYESWWGIDTLPNVNEMEPSYRDFIIHNKNSVIRHWSKLGAKGWRLDVADELPDQFIRELRQVLKENDPDAVLIGEVWEDASHKYSYGELRGYLYGNELDTVTNYPFRRLVLDYLLGRQDAAAISDELFRLYENYPKQHFFATLNIIGSHDVPRAITMLGGHETLPDLPYGQQLKRRLQPEERLVATARLKMAALWQFTFPGTPCLYYGDEVGLEGYTDPLNRRTFPWGREDAAIQDWYQKIIALRNTYPVLRTGDWEPLAPHPDVFGYVRTIQNGLDAFGSPADDNTAVILLNRSLSETTVEIDLSPWCRGMLFDVLNHDCELAVGDGRVIITLKPLEGKLLLARLANQPLKCGVLLHPTSLPSEHGIGGLGSEAHRFIDFLAAGKQHYWQILPLNPVGAGNSPYQSVSAFACEPLLIDIELVLQDGLLTKSQIADARQKFRLAALPADKVDYETVKKYKDTLFRQAFSQFANQRRTDEYENFVNENNYWLPDYALYMALSSHFGEPAWNRWPATVANREDTALRHYAELLEQEINYQYFLQYTFYRQWLMLKNYAQQKGIGIIGDLPIFVAHASADVWSHPRLFELDKTGEPSVVAGVPPDYFSKTGQLWGNPLYRWKEMDKNGYDWWRQRFARLFSQVDIVRIDHFRGFEDYWEVPAGEETAVNGRWVKGPGKKLFAALERYFGKLPVIAEDLGIITPEVISLRRKFGYPGMKVLHFAFGYGYGGCVAPLGCDRDVIVYSGTHDNATTLGWYQHLAATGTTECVDKYLGYSHKESKKDVAWRMVELAYQCKAETAIIPLQDLVGLDDKARMNTPGTVNGNWQWRAKADTITPNLAAKIAALAVKHRRNAQ